MIALVLLWLQAEHYLPDFWSFGVLLSIFLALLGAILLAQVWQLLAFEIRAWRLNIRPIKWCPSCESPLTPYPVDRRFDSKYPNCYQRSARLLVEEHKE